jgi:opacity protein-like surface antigen
VPEELLPPGRVFVGPDLFNPPAHQGWLTLTPSFTLSGEYNDNIFLSARDRRSDFSVGFTPGVTLSIQRPGFRLLGGYNISGHVFVDESSQSNFGKDQNFFVDAFYEMSPGVSFTLSDQFIYSRDTDAVSSGGVSVGHRDAWRNTLTPRLRWQATPNTALLASASHTILRFQGNREGPDSDTYRAGLGAEHRLTARLTGTAGFDFGYFDIKGEPKAFTYTPNVGLGYDVTQTLRASVTGGPSVVHRDGDTTVSPSVGAQLSQRFKFGVFLLGYDRAVTAETVGLSDRQSVFASLVLPTLRRGLQIEFTPRYSIVDTDVSGTNRSTSTDKTLTLNLSATYQIARNISVIGGYTFFHQTSDRSGADLDQNRVYLGLQYAFPINFY